MNTAGSAYSPWEAIATFQDGKSPVNLVFSSPTTYLTYTH